MSVTPAANQILVCVGTGITTSASGRVCGFPLDAETSDEMSFVRFRSRLRGPGLYERLFAEPCRQLEAKDLMVKTGRLVDGTVIEARARPPRPSECVVDAVDPDAGLTIR